MKLIPKLDILLKAKELWESYDRFSYLCDVIGDASGQLQGYAECPYQERCDNAKELQEEIAALISPFGNVQTFLGYHYFDRIGEQDCTNQNRPSVLEFRENLLNDLIKKYSEVEA